MNEVLYNPIDHGYFQHISPVARMNAALNGGMAVVTSWEVSGLPWTDGTVPNLGNGIRCAGLQLTLCFCIASARILQMCRRDRSLVA